MCALSYDAGNSCSPSPRHSSGSSTAAPASLQAAAARQAEASPAEVALLPRKRFSKSSAELMRYCLERGATLVYTRGYQAFVFR